MQCPHFDAARCRSCTLLGQPCAEQLAAKQKHCQDLIGERADLQWTPRVGLSEQGEDGGERHLHSAIGYRPPNEVHDAYRSQEMAA